MKKVVILLPTYNEKDSIEKFITNVFAEEKNAQGWKFEILVVNDERSNDGTEEVVKKVAQKNPSVHYLKLEPGLGTALIKGHQYSIEHFKPDALAQLDADSQVEANVVPKMLNALDEGYNLALGSRFVKGGKNQLSPIRKLFSYGASLVFRILVGPIKIKEVTNSARAFTPELFKKINLKRLPWKEQTFIIQPAFLHEAILAGANYKEVPLIFNNRLEGYSKNKVFNYTYDVITYSIGVFLEKIGININFFYLTRRAKTFVKFGLVGFIGTMVDFFFYKFFINYFGLPPATSKGFSTEIAIINNFLLNNFWTFRYRKTKTNIWQKLGIFNLVSLGGLTIAVLIVKYLHLVFGDGYVNVLGLNLAYNNFYFFATIPPVLIWNFLINHLITWKHDPD